MSQSHDGECGQHPHSASEGSKVKNLCYDVRPVAINYGCDPKIPAFGILGPKSINIL